MKILEVSDRSLQGCSVTIYQTYLFQIKLSHIKWKYIVYSGKYFSRILLYVPEGQYKFLLT